MAFSVYRGIPLSGGEIVVYNPRLEVVRREIIYEQGGRSVDTRYVGYSFIYHNTTFSPEKEVKKYYNKDIIEWAFKKTKGILSLFEFYLKKFDISALELIEKLKRDIKCI